MKKTQCGDWHRSWGLSTTLIGKLSKVSETKFEWSGKSQGRHGQIHRRNLKGSCHFVDDNIIKIEGTLPDLRDVRDAINILNKPEQIKKIRQIKQSSPKAQLSIIF